MYCEFIKEVMLCLKVIKKDFKYGVMTLLNHNEAVLLYFVHSSTGSPYLLAEELDQDPAQVYRNLKKLEEMNLVEREKCGKKANYTLTGEGVKMVATLIEGVDNFTDLYPELAREMEELIGKLRILRERAIPILSLE